MRQWVTPRNFCIKHASSHVSGQVVWNLFFMIIYITYYNIYHYFRIIKQWQTGHVGHVAGHGSVFLYTYDLQWKLLENWIYIM